jgi:hypothetical protein
MRSPYPGTGHGGLLDFGKFASGYFAQPIKHLACLSAWGLLAREAKRYGSRQSFNFFEQERVCDNGSAQRPTNIIVASGNRLIHLTLQSFGMLGLSWGGLGYCAAPGCRGSHLYGREQIKYNPPEVGAGCNGTGIPRHWTVCSE